MSVFGAYSRYYNLFYRDKDYAGEAAYVRRLIEQHRPGARSILDLGCGTGRHAFLLAEMGYDVTGVDRSEEMLAVAGAQLSSLNAQQDSAQPSTLISQQDDSLSALDFIHGDIRTVRLSRTFDVVVSLFHVMSYQTANEDLAAAFATASTHLKPGGVFIFDCWYGPAVLTDRPVVRVKRMEDDEIAVTRIVEPVMYPATNIVETKYHVIIRDKATDCVNEIQETHRMRYLFQPEVELILENNGMRLEENMEWMTGRIPGYDTWGVCFVAKEAAKDTT